MAATHQFLIASYRKDFEWLRANLRSLAKFADGFLPPAIVIPSEDVPCALEMLHGCRYELCILDGPGFGRAQVAMMSGDIYCPGADYVYLSGSDCMAIRPFNPNEYWLHGKPLMLYNTWGHLSQHAAPCMFWKAGVEKALGGNSHGEFMRRLPICYPRGLYAGVRAAIEKRHRVSFFDYVVKAVNHERNFSESDVMGEWAWRNLKASYTWHCLDKQFYEGASAITQFWSHGGLDHPSDRHGGRRPREIITELLDT